MSADSPSGSRPSAQDVPSEADQGFGEWAVAHLADRGAFSGGAGNRPYRWQWSGCPGAWALAGGGFVSPALGLFVSGPGLVGLLLYAGGLGGQALGHRGRECHAVCVQAEVGEEDRIAGAGWVVRSEQAPGPSSTIRARVRGALRAGSRLLRRDGRASRPGCPRRTGRAECGCRGA